MLKPLGTATTPTATGPAKGPRPASSPPTSHCIRTFYQAWLKVGAREYTLYMSAFVPLRVHSHYSLLKALPKIPALVARAKAEGCEALALTDLGNLYGAIEFYKECKEAGIKPIIGLSANVGDGKRILLYAENKEGYQNLLLLVTKSNLESPGSPIIT